MLAGLRLPGDPDPRLGLEPFGRREQGIAAALVIPGDAPDFDRLFTLRAG